MKNINKAALNKIILVFISLFLVVIVILSVQTSALGVELSHLERQQKDLLSQKTLLEDEVARNVSLKQAQKMAKKNKFTNEYEVIYLQDQGSFAQLMDSR